MNVGFRVSRTGVALFKIACKRLYSLCLAFASNQRTPSSEQCQMKYKETKPKMPSIITNNVPKSQTMSLMT
jgi:hypothetical protein